jgi:hypothetical protein
MPVLPIDRRLVTVVPEVRDVPVAMHVHAWLAVVGCLVASQWLQWWTFFVALTLVTSLGLRFYLVTQARAAVSVIPCLNQERTPISDSASRIA